jgi:protein-S-isoprenylcysteine O-methyltransferase Ste14
MSLYRWIILGLWVLFVVYWALAATRGSALGVDLFWLPLAVAVGAYFIYSARREEAAMLQLFPEQYAASRARTGMLAPCPFRRPSSKSSSQSMSSEKHTP